MTTAPEADAGRAERIENLAYRLRATLLSGDRKRVTDDIEEWGREHAPDMRGEKLLEAFNNAAADSEVQARQILEDEALTDNGKPILIALLNRQGTTDRERLLALDVIAALVEPTDIPELARVSAKQRAGVLPRTLEVLAEVPSPEAGFALRRVLGEGDGASNYDARQRAQQMLDELPEARALLSPGQAEGLEDQGLLVAGLALESDQQANIRHGSEPGLTARLAETADSLDTALVAAGRRPSGLNEYEAPLRRQLHIFTLLADLPGESRLRERALDTLFAEDLDRVATAAPLLPPAALKNYLERALTTANRRRNPDRARLALRLVGALPPQERSAIRGVAAEALDQADPELRVEAALALVTAYDDLTQAERAALRATHDALPADLQARLAPHLGVLAEELAGGGDLPSFLAWASAAPQDEAALRFGAVLDRWRTSAPTPEDAASISRALGDLFERLPTEQRNLSERAFADIAATWLRQRGGTAAASRALLTWSGFAAIALSHFAVFAEALPGRGARRLLSEAIQDSGEADPERIAAAAGVSLNSAQEILLVLPVLISMARGAPAAFTEAYRHADESGRRRLLRSALDAHHEAVRKISDLETAIVTESTEALVARRDRVLQALDEAEDESQGNEALLGQFAAIRRALALDAGSAGKEPAEEVQRWRREAAARFPSMVDALEAGRQQVRIRDDSIDENGLLTLMTELDRKAYARGTAPAADRALYRQDVEAFARAFVSSGMFGRERTRSDSLATRRSPELTRLLDELWAASLQGRLGDELETALTGAADGPAAREALRLVDTLAGHSDEGTTREVVERLEAAQLEGAWDKTVVVLTASGRRQEQLATEMKRQEREAMARIAGRLQLPFQAIESYLFGYFRLRQILGEAGWGRATPSLGAELDRQELDLERHEIRGEGEGETFVVRSLGITVLGSPAYRAIVEALESESPDGNATPTDDAEQSPQ